MVLRAHLESYVIVALLICLQNNSRVFPRALSPTVSPNGAIQVVAIMVGCLLCNDPDVSCCEVELLVEVGASIWLCWPLDAHHV